jgi:hypothetical protein
MADPKTFGALGLLTLALIGTGLSLSESGQALAAAPVLVLTGDNVGSPFGDYLAEIMRGEGLLAFEQRDRAAWASAPDPGALLAGYSAVVLPEMSLLPAEQQLLRNYVQAGGVLIGARPEVGMSDVYGIEPAGNRPERLLQYFGVDAELPPGRGTTHGALQYHGVAANYNLQVLRRGSLSSSTHTMTSLKRSPSIVLRVASGRVRCAKRSRQRIRARGCCASIRKRLASR